MKKLISGIIATAMLTTVAATGVSATGYGDEWEGYYHNAPVTFTDVPSTHWAHNAIMRVYEKNWFKGYPDGRFNPNGSITRAEAVTVFVQFLGLQLQDVTKSSFYDVDASKWYAPYIEAGKDLFPVHTTIQGKTPFNPEMPVTREDTIYALVNALGCSVGVKYTDQSILNMFKDQSSISGDLKAHFAIALNHELVSGFPDGTIRAQAALTRAEFATLLLRGTEHGFHDTYEAKISSVAVSPASPVEMVIGETATLSARATYTDGKNLAYTGLQPYDSTNNGVISLNGTTVTGLKEGTAVIKFNDSYSKDSSVVVVVKKPTDAPLLKITEYSDVTEAAEMTIKGMVSDNNASRVDLTCNGRDIVVNADGSFLTSVSLKVGTNDFSFTAKNGYGVETTKKISIVRNQSTNTNTNTNTNADENGSGESSNENNNGTSTSTNQDGTPYFTFDRATGTITACGTSASEIIVPAQIDGVNVYHIGEEAFAGCNYLESIEFPDSLKTIHAYAFKDCTKLLEINIPASVTSISEGAFSGCTALYDVVIEGEIKKIDEKVFSGCKRLASITLPETLKSINAYAFEGCKSLTELVIPERVTEIGEGAFTDCGSLAMIEIPDSVTTIADSAFDGCNSLKIYASVNSVAIEFAKANGIAWEII